MLLCAIRRLLSNTPAQPNNPSLDLRVSNDPRASPFVNKSANCSLVGIYWILNVPSCNFSRMKLYRMSTCFILLWSRGSWAMQMHDWLSSCSTMGWSSLIPSSRIRFLSQIASQIAWLNETYSASVEERATVLCLRVIQEIVPSNT